MTDTIIIKDGHIDCKSWNCSMCPVHNLTLQGLQVDDYFASEYTDEIFCETGYELCSQIVVYAKFYDPKNWRVRNVK